MSNTKTHYRKVQKSDHLGVADIEDYVEAGSPLVFTIQNVRQELGVRVAGSKGDHNIAYFNDKVGNVKVKPWVINATNGRTLKDITNSSFIEDWAGCRVQMYIDPSVKMKGELVGGIRLNPNPPPPELPEFPFANEGTVSNAIAAYKRDGNFLKVATRYLITDDVAFRLEKLANAPA